MPVPAQSKIVKKGNSEPDQFELSIAQALLELQNNSDLKAQLRELYITKAKEIELFGKKVSYRSQSVGRRYLLGGCCGKHAFFPDLVFHGIIHFDVLEFLPSRPPLTVKFLIMLICMYFPTFVFQMLLCYSCSNNILFSTLVSKDYPFVQSFF